MKIFLDTSVIIAALLSPDGGSAQIVEFCEAKLLQGFIAGDVERELFEVVQRKFPEALPHTKQLLKAAQLKMVKKIKPAFLKRALRWIGHQQDALILAAAVQAEVDYLTTLDIRHFLKDPSVAQKSHIKICTPGDFLKIFGGSLN